MAEAPALMSSTVVLVGHVGSGKSTLVEKVTGVTGISSDASESFTRASTAIPSVCGRLTVIDTPGTNSMSDKLEHNLWIAHALNSQPVSLILSVVKADPRMDNVVDAIRHYAETFVDTDLFGICVTHMDTVKWTSTEFLPRLHEELGIDGAVFVGTGTPSRTAIAHILKECKNPRDMTIDSDNFLKFFKISSNNIKILKTVRNEVGAFKTINRQFLEYLRSCDEADRVDAAFEFQAYMSEQVTEAQKRVAEANHFTFMGPDMGNELGHHANLTNQLRSVLFEVRTMTLGFAASHGVTDMRKCPHCGQVWVKVAGCDGGTTCGNLMKSLDARNNGQMGTFAFNWDGSNFRVSKSGHRPRTSRSGVARGIGCGKEIVWATMTPVRVPSEFMEHKEVSVEDVKVVPEKARPSWTRLFNESLAALGPMKRRHAAP